MVGISIQLIKPSLKTMPQIQPMLLWAANLTRLRVHKVGRSILGRRSEARALHLGVVGVRAAKVPD